MSEEFKEGLYKLFIYYKNEEHPMIVERGSLEDAEKWLHNKHNRNHFKNCSRWLIKNNYGEEVRKGNTELEIKIV